MNNQEMAETLQQMMEDWNTATDEQRRNALELANELANSCLRGERLESLRFLAEWSGIKYNTLARAAKEGRLEARRSGNVWLSTRQAVKTYRENAVFKPRREQVDKN